MTTIENTSVSVPSLGDSRPARLLPAAALLSLVTIAIGVLGLQAHVRGGLSAVDGVALALVFAWSLAGLVEARFADRTPAW
ncbi:MAG: hypothetical protein WB592_06470, partial [Acidimicrobiales bacterium]